MINLLILTESPFSKRDYDRFGIELLSQSFRVRVLDCTLWLNPEVLNQNLLIVYSCSIHAPVANFDAFCRQLNNPNKSIAIDYLGNCSKSKQIRDYLKNKHIPRVVVHSGLLPAPNSSWLSRLYRSFAASKISSFPKKTYEQIRQIISSDPEPEIVLLSGTAGMSDRRLSGVKHRIWAHSLDYDIYLRERNRDQQAIEPYAVFLDEDMVHHTDYAHLRVKPPATEAAYYTAMNAFFQEFEQEIGLPIVIAAHPRARYDLRPQLWNGRKTIAGNTAALVRDASVVLCHQSTSVSFAVLWRKPLVFLTTNELMASFIGPRITLLSAILRAPLVNIDKKDHARNMPCKVDEEAYAKYVCEYIKKPGSPDLPLWQIFSEYVKRELCG